MPAHSIKTARTNNKHADDISFCWRFCVGRKTWQRNTNWNHNRLVCALNTQHCSPQKYRISNVLSKNDLMNGFDGLVDCNFTPWNGNARSRRPPVHATCTAHVSHVARSVLRVYRLVIRQKTNDCDGWKSSMVSRRTECSKWNTKRKREHE